MMTCPRCGFTQPQDRFCAQCGLDVERYQPSPKPLWQAITTHVLFQIVVVLTIVIATTYAIYQRKRNVFDSALSTHTQNFPNAFTSAGSTPRPSPRKTPVEATHDIKARGVQLTAKTNIDSNSEVDAAVATDTEGTTQNPNGGRPDAEASGKNDEDKKGERDGSRPLVIQSIKVVAMLIPVAQLSYLVEGAHTLGASGGMRAYGLKSWTQALQRLRDARGNIVEIDQGQIFLSDTATSDWRRHVYDSNIQQELGLTVTFGKIAGDQPRFTVKIERTLRDPRENLNWSLGNIAASTKGEVSLVTGLLPHRKLQSSEQILLSSTFFRIMATSEFQEGLVDLALLIEPQLQP